MPKRKQTQAVSSTDNNPKKAKPQKTKNQKNDKKAKTAPTKKPHIKLTREPKPTSSSDNSAQPPTGKRLMKDFFEKDCTTLSKDLLGKRIVREFEDKSKVWGVIVETEAYLGGDDAAAHSFEGKRTPKNEAMFMDPGTIYVYHIYGLYTCINFSSNGEGAAVLIRAVDMEGGLEEMMKRRSAKKKAGSKPLQDKELGNGPSKLTQAMGIVKEGFNQEHTESSSVLWLEEGIHVAPEGIVTSARVGIDSAGEKWSKAPLRFYVLGNKSVSKRDKEAEKTP